MQKQMHCHEVILRGLPISKGVGIGFPIFFSFFEEEVPDSPLSHREVEEEVGRYRRALDLSRQDLERLQKLSHHERAPEVAAILGTHLEMIEDPLITQEVEERIRLKQRKTESIFQHLIAEYQNRFTVLQDSYFRERVRDIVDLSRRILSHLRQGPHSKMMEMTHNSVILAHELVPSETIEANASLVSGFVTAAGGLTSHAAIIARAKGIPYVANIDIKFLKRVEFQSVIVDGSEGLVIVNPTLQTLKKYQEIKKSYLERDRLLQSETHLKGETIDGYEIQVFANLEYPKEVDLSLKMGASGVGLFRSEYLFLARKAFPSEEEQFTIYCQMIEALKGKPLVVRVFDVGGEKKGDLPESARDAKYFLPIGREVNPALGCRAIRFLLRYPELLEEQLSAILRASHYGDIQILIPMVSDLSEIRKVRSLINQVRDKLHRQGIPTA
ncbi:MAG: phosphoenolpyruvate--protein phosphotransferase, partial [Verrucomicrobia bacterium RIFCSPHIGHO2_12_FULL_41_10]